MTLMSCDSVYACAARLAAVADWRQWPTCLHAHMG